MRTLILRAAACLPLLWANAMPMATTAVIAAGETANAALTQIFQQLYTARDRATAGKDTAALFASYSPDFVNIDLHGSRDTLPSFKRHYAHMAAAATSIVSTSDVRQVSVSGKTATLVVSGSVKVALIDPHTGNPVLAQDTETDRDTWVKGKSGWLETMSQSLAEEFTINGKIIPMTQRAAPGTDPSST